MILRLLFAVLFTVFLAGPAAAADPPPRKFKTGARRSPAHKILAAPKFQPVKAAPAQVAYIPQKLSMWGNDTHGNCVSAEEAFAKATYSPEIFLPDATVTAWAQANGYLEGADLASVLQSMQSGGFVVGQQKYNDGAPSTVDYTTESVLQAAVAQGPVKVAIDSTALPQTAGTQQGWYAIGGGNFPNTDHCVSVCGYGPAEWLYQQLGVQLPAALAGKSGYLVFTWSTIGFVDFAWLQSTCVEAWLRNPTTVGVPPLTPTPPPVTLTKVVATFSDGSTQTLGGNGGLTAEKLKGMTLQQLADYIAGKGMPKPAPAPGPVPPVMPPARPTTFKRLLERIDRDSEANDLLRRASLVGRCPG